MADLWFTLFPNKYHKDGDKRPVATGTIEITEPLAPGKYKLAAWRRDTKLNVKIQPDDRAEQPQQEQGTEQATAQHTPPPPPSIEIKDDSGDWN